MRRAFCLEEVDDTFARLAGWLRGTFSKDSRTFAGREAAWATRVACELVEETKVVSARVLVATQTGAILEVEVKSLPHADAFARWLRSVSEALRAGAHRLDTTESR